jgi:hypothetical protein
MWCHIVQLIPSTHAPPASTADSNKDPTMCCEKVQPTHTKSHHCETIHYSCQASRDLTYGTPDHNK